MKEIRKEKVGCQKPVWLKKVNGSVKQMEKSKRRRRIAVI